MLCCFEYFSERNTELSMMLEASTVYIYSFSPQYRYANNKYIVCRHGKLKFSSSYLCVMHKMV